MLGDNFARTLAQVRNGDEAAFAALYRAHNPALAGFLRRRSITAAEDLASETWIGVARGLERFEGEESDFQRWLFTIARRRLVDHIRKVKRSPETTALAVDPSGGGDPLESVLSGELGAAALARDRAVAPRPSRGRSVAHYWRPRRGGHRCGHGSLSHRGPNFMSPRTQGFSRNHGF